jgi:hypothetical protein
MRQEKNGRKECKKREESMGGKMSCRKETIKNRGRSPETLRNKSTRSEDGDEDGDEHERRRRLFFTISGKRQYMNQERKHTSFCRLTLFAPHTLFLSPSFTPVFQTKLLMRLKERMNSKKQLFLRQR